MYTKKQLYTALLNLQWLMRNREPVGIYVDTETIVTGDGGGYDLDVIVEEGLTPATRKST